MRKNRYLILSVLCLAGAMVPFSSSSVNLAVKNIASELAMNAVAMAWIVTAMMLPSAVLQIPLGKLGDIFGRKKVLIIGIFLFSCASLGCLLVKTGFALLLMRFLQGMGAASMFSATMAIIMNIFPKEERGKAIGINTAIVYLALASGPVIGGLLTQVFGWRSIFIVTACMGFLSLIGIFILLRNEEWTEVQKGKFDYTGTAVYSVALVGILWGFSLLPAVEGILLTAAGLISLAGFVFIEKKQESPMFEMRMFLANRVFRFSLFAALINYAATFAIGFLISLYLQYIKGLNPREAGWILLAQPVMMMLVSPLAGKWSDKADAGKIATLGMSVIVVCLSILAFVSGGTPLWILILILLVLGCGFGLFSSPNTNVIMSSVEKRYLGMASATTGTMRQVGQSLSMGITMMAVSIFVGNIRLTPEVYPSLMKCLRVTFAVFAVLCCAGVYFSAIRKEKSA
ncbi:MAG: MFS transporter [Dysgonamonadaceae bacterium]|jgi:MFS family permease|nr:MFS transporter [Dysgonamonadaceae bacterium]